MCFKYAPKGRLSRWKKLIPFCSIGNQIMYFIKLRRQNKSWILTNTFLELISPTCLWAAFTHTHIPYPKSAKRTVKLLVFFALLALGSALVKSARKMLAKSTPVVNFIKALQAGRFSCNDPVSTKKTDNLTVFFSPFGIWAHKSCSKNVDEIYTWSFFVVITRVWLTSASNLSLLKSFNELSVQSWGLITSSL